MGKRVYRVKKGDDFIKISRKLYGDPSYVMDLMRANPGFNWLGPGMVLRLPKMDPRLMRQRKMRRRLKLYGPPPEETEDTMGQDFPTEEEEGLSEGEVSEPEYGEGAAAGLIQGGESLDWWNDPAKFDELIGLMEGTVKEMGLGKEGSFQSKMGEVSTTPGKASSKGQNQFKSKEGGVIPSGLTTYSEALSQAALESTTPPVTLSDEQIDTLKEELEKLGLDVDVAMEELGLGESVAASSTTAHSTGEGDEAKDSSGGKVAKPAQPQVPTPTPGDEIPEYQDIETREELETWFEAVYDPNGSNNEKDKLEKMYLEKRKELEESSQATGVSTGSLPPPPTPKPEGNTPEENMYINLYNLSTEKELRAWKDLLSRMGFSEENMRGFLELASIKEQELNSNRQNPFGNTIIPLSGFQDVIIPSFQYQHDVTQTTPNDCTEASMAMLINMMLKKDDPSNKGINFSDLARDMDKKWWKFYRFTAGSPLPGVTPPTGAVKLLNDYGKSHEPEWTAELSALNTTDDLLQNLLDGNPTMIYGVNLSGKKLPHAVVPVGFDTATKEWIILNPGIDPVGNQQIYVVWSDQELKDFWYGNRFEGIPIFGHNTMITLYPNP